MTREQSEGFDVDYELTRLFRRLREHAVGRLHEIHDDLDYNSLLLFIGVADAENGVRASDLAERMHVHKSTVSRGVSTLQRLGLVERGRDPDDGRAQVLTVPPAARTSLEAYRRRSYDWLGRLYSGWTDADVQTFARQVARLADAAELTPDR